MIEISEAEAFPSSILLPTAKQAEKYLLNSYLKISYLKQYITQGTVINCKKWTTKMYFDLYRFNPRF